MNNYILGLDLGITSVGYGIIDKDTLEIIKYGVRLFEEANAENNLTRRTKRSQRRTLRRRQQRIIEIRRLINKEIIDEENFKQLQNTYELRVKGLTQKLTNNELANVLINIAKKRGSSLEVVVDESDKESLELSSSLTKNTQRLKNENKYICELQLEQFVKEGKVKGHSNIFKTEDYVKEVTQILKNQELSDELNNKIIDIIQRRRDFAEGPGDENSPTIYGRFKGEYDENGNKIIYNLIDLMRGKCSIYPEELCSPKNSYDSCLFNLLNDLNNLTITRNEIKDKITKEEKLIVIDKVIETGKISIKELTKVLNVEKEDISGFRVNKNQEPQLTKFEVYEKFLKISKLTNNTNILNLDFFNQTIDILTKTQIYDERLVEIDKIKSNLALEIDTESIEKIALLTKINGYHSLSKKAILEITDEMIEEPVNQQQVISSSINKNNKVTSGFNIQYDEKLILSPVAKRVQQEAIKVLNDLRKTYGEFNAIMIETTRSKNSADERKNIEKIQKINEQNKLNAVTLAQDNNVSLDKLNGSKKLKLRLYNEQNGKCIYTGNPINLDVLLSDDTAYEVEHIIPYSISFDNSLNNKSLAESSANRHKGNNTPYYYFKSGKAYGVINSYEQFKTYVNSLNISRNKKDNLLNEEDICKFSNQKRFINRNLIDTSYGVRSFMNTIANHYKNNDIDTVVRTTKGKITNMYRGIGQIDENGIKNRNYLIHHAIDALIIAGVGSQKAVRKAYESFEVDEVTGEVYENPIEDSKFRRYLKEIKNINNSSEKTNENLFSYKVDSKTCRQVADETIYSTRIKEDGEFVVKKYKDIYGKEGESLTKLFKEDKAKEKLLMFKNDINTFNILQKVYDDYKDAKDKNDKLIKNVFEYYYSLTGSKIRKYSKKDNGPEINSIKYYDGKLGNHISITKNYNTNNKNVVLLQISPYRTDIYKNKDGLYKFVTIRRKHVINKDGKNYIDSNLYQELKNNKSIDDSFEFQFTLNRNNILKLVTEESETMYRFIGTCNDLTNRIECKMISSSITNPLNNENKQLMLSIGKKTKLIEKYNVSPTGKYKKVEKENLKLIF